MICFELPVEVFTWESFCLILKRRKDVSWSLLRRDDMLESTHFDEFGDVVYFDMLAKSIGLEMLHESIS